MDAVPFCKLLLVHLLPTLVNLTYSLGCFLSHSFSFGFFGITYNGWYAVVLQLLHLLHIDTFTFCCTSLLPKVAN
uniref:Uncharacterized protein n=1 Tax=Amblyomma cajennense TaxID=34607 RepID=A0A023FBK7_AMBCJ